MSRSVLLAQLVVAAWVAASVALNPLGGRYVRRLAGSLAEVKADAPDPGSVARVSGVGLPGLRSVASLAEPGNSARAVDVFQTPDALVTVMLDDGHLTALSRLQDGRILYTGGLAIVPSAQVLVNLKAGATPVEALGSHFQLARKLAEIDLGTVAHSAGISLELLELERRALIGLGPITATFLGLHGEARAHRLLVAPNREELLELGLGYKHSPSLTPRPQSSVASTDLRSYETITRPASS